MLSSLKCNLPEVGLWCASMYFHIPTCLLKTFAWESYLASVRHTPNVARQEMVWVKKLATLCSATSKEQKINVKACEKSPVVLIHPLKICHHRIRRTLCLNKHGFYHWHIPCYQMHSQLSHMAAFSINCSYSKEKGGLCKQLKESICSVCAGRPQSEYDS